MNSANELHELTGCTPDSIVQTVEGQTRPALIRGLVKDWGIVEAASKSSKSVRDYLLKFYSGDAITVFAGEPSIAGKIGYNDDLLGFNYQQGTTSLSGLFEQLLYHTDTAAPPAIYMGSTLLDRWFPGIRDQNDLRMSDASHLASIWIGNQVRVSAHFDVANNIACNVAGQRRFTLFPPEQLENLYIGPWDFTPAGQAISLVDFAAPDFNKHPKFQEALKASYSVTLEPGDAIYIPSMWWHHVEGLDSINILINYWWRSTRRFLGSPLAAFKHALLELRELPLEQRQAWQSIFNHYVFNHDEENLAHMPPSARGILDDMDDATARKLRAELLNHLNR